MGSQRVVHDWPCTHKSSYYFTCFYYISNCDYCRNVINADYFSQIVRQYIVEVKIHFVNKLCNFITSSVPFSRSVMSDTLQPHEPQHTRPPCLSPTPGVHPNPCPSSQWCHPAISSSVVPFSSCLQYFPTSQSFQMSHLFTSGGQSIGVSASTSVLPMNT